MSRADRIVDRRAWISSNPWKLVDKGVKERKLFRRWVLEWRLFKTHDSVKVHDGMARMLNEREAKRTTNAEATRT